MLRLIDIKDTLILFVVDCPYSNFKQLAACFTYRPLIKLNSKIPDKLGTYYSAQVAPVLIRIHENMRAPSK
jgi:hypothetical protein